MILINIFILTSTISCNNIQTLDNFNLSEYIRHKWYIQKQQETQYLPKDYNYCVTAKYEISTKKIPFYNGTVLSVENYAKKNNINGELVNKNNTTLCARQTKVKSKLLVAPCFLPNIFAGDYWIIDAGPKSNDYQWAIVSGGNPTQQYKNGCTTKTNTINNAGLWLFTKIQVANQTIINYMLNKLKTVGFKTDLLNNVTQYGCKY